MKQKIKIDWTMTLPPSSEGTPYRWPKQDIEPHGLDSALSWPEGTNNFLITAFEKGLDRFTPWDVQDLAKQEAIETAALVYKRGVGVKGVRGKRQHGSYEISFLKQKPCFRETICIIDQKVAELWSMESGPRTLILTLDERHKSLPSVGEILAFLQDFPKDQAVFLVGGGILTDTAAFACALDQRPFQLVPTTLLAMADACVGGKTGVNLFPYGKNQVGMFAFPQKVLIWPDWLRTLSTQDFKAGLGECYKHFLISRNKKILPIFQTDAKQVTRETLMEVIEVKAAIVARDPGEAGERALLNLGHTLAHALEAVSQDSGQGTLLHGEAVSLGLLFSLLLSVELGHLPRPQADIFIEELMSFGLILNRDSLERALNTDNLHDPEFMERFYGLIAKDKKSVNGTARWVLLCRDGCYVNDQEFTHEVSKQAFLQTYETFLARLN